MDLFTYLMAKNGHNTSIHKDLFSYLLGKSQGGGGEIKTATGITIYIPDAKKLVSFMMTKESTQDGEPTPENPVEVETVKGYRNLLRNTLEILKENNVEGTWNDNVYTLNDVTFTCNNDGSITATGTASAITYFYINRNGYNVTPLSAGTYYLNSFVTGSNTTWKMQYNDGSGSNNLFGTEISKTYTETTNIIAFYIIIYSGQNPDGITFYPIITQSSNIPYVPYGNNYIYTKVVGKNLFDKESATYKNGYIKNDSGNETTSSLSGYLLSYIEVEPNKKYTIQGSLITTSNGCRIYFYDNNKNWISRTNVIWNIPASFETPNNCYYIQFQYTQTVYNENNIQVEYGDNTTTYEEYKETIVPIPLNNNEIAGKWNLYDELMVDKLGKSYLNKKLGIKVFDGTESFRIYNSDNTRTVFEYSGITDIQPYIYSGNNPYLLSSHFISKTQSASWTYGTISRRNTGTMPIYMTMGANETVETFKSWLQGQYNAGTPVKLLYILETPELIDLQTTVDLSLFKGTNTITNSEDGYMTIEYVSENEEA